MQRIFLTMMVAMPLALGACGGDKPADGKTEAKGDEGAKEADAGEAEAADEAEAMDPRVEKAVTIANEIAKNPDDADAILEKNGLDREGFEKLMYEIAKDPELSKSYAIHREA
ncbi:MAG: hypothetical protein H6710_14125 [Myxococcales bacterium]|nr:hypothetical protein [Myxococcales bacterium]MCB9705047.1 hypothetical protein [Myxococcales bacterium]